MNSKSNNFFQERYGYDILTKFFAVVTIILLFLENFFRNNYVLIGVLLIYTYMCIFRPLSKNKKIRQKELTNFLNLTRPFQKIFLKSKVIAENSKTKTDLECPKCHHMLKEPKEKGKIKITCPYCQYEFIKRI